MKNTPHDPQISEGNTCFLCKFPQLNGHTNERSFGTRWTFVLEKIREAQTSPPPPWLPALARSLTRARAGCLLLLDATGHWKSTHSKISPLILPGAHGNPLRTTAARRAMSCIREQMADRLASFCRHSLSQAQSLLAFPFSCTRCS